MNANKKMNLGQNTYRRKHDWERKRRVVIDIEAGIVKEFNVWKPYPNLPIAPGLPDDILDRLEYGLPDSKPTRSTCEDSHIDCGEEFSFDLSKYNILNKV